jgi:hypothetical protein
MQRSGAGINFGLNVSLNATSPFVISGFRSDAEEICALLGYYDVSGQRIRPIFNCQEVQDLDFLILKYGTDRLSRNVGKRQPLDAALISQKSADLVLHLVEGIFKLGEGTLASFLAVVRATFAE